MLRLSETAEQKFTQGFAAFGVVAAMPSVSYGVAKSAFAIAAPMPAIPEPANISFAPAALDRAM